MKISCSSVLLEARTADAQNEELKALEAYILKLSQQGKRCIESVSPFSRN